MPWYNRRDLERTGLSGRAISRAVANGTLIRLRRDSYCTPGTDASLQNAARAGGRLTCVSELRRRGVWVLGDDDLHIRVPPHAGRVRQAPGVHVHWEPIRSGRGSSPLHVSASDAMEAALRCLTPPMAVASLDSLLHQRLISPRELDGIRARATADERRWIGLAEPLAESGLESITRVVLLQLGLRVRSQVSFPREKARVDLLVEDWVVVETDGDAFHDEKVTTRDRRRDAALARRGYVVLRFRYAQVVYELDAVAHAVVATVAQHRRVRNAGEVAARARSRLRRIDFS